MRLEASNIKSKFASHLLDDIHSDSRSIGFVVDGEKGYTTLVLGNNGIGCNNTGTARLASPFRAYWHTDFTDTRTEFCTLVWVFFKTFQEICIVICHAPIALGQTFDGHVKILMSIDFVTHQSNLLPDGTCQIFPSQEILSSLSFPDRFQRLHCAGVFLQALQAWVLNDNAHDGNAGLHAPHGRPFPDIWSDWRGILVYLLSSFFAFGFIIRCKGTTFI